MFDLEDSIKTWRRHLNAGTAEALDELECHLRDDVETEVDAGSDPQTAFEAAVARLGGKDLLEREFRKLGGGGRARVNQLFCILASIPNTHPEIHMNATLDHPSIEPRWATYTKAAAFVSPAIVLWSFSVLYLIPKLQQICRESGVALPAAYRAATFVGDHTVLILGCVLLVLVLLEWRANPWPRYRRAFLGGAAFVINTAVLVLITLMVVLALLAAPALLYQGR